MKNRQSNVELIIRAAVAVTGVQPFPAERRVNLAISDASFKKIGGPQIASPKFKMIPWLYLEAHFDLFFDLGKCQ